MSSPVDSKAEHLRSLVRLLTEASQDVIQSWEEEETQLLDHLKSSRVPSHKLFEARRTVLGAVGMIIDLVQEPQARLMEMCSQFYEARALHIAAHKRVPDLLADADPKQGISSNELSLKTGIKAHKLARVLRCLCSAHIFAEVRPNYFANSPTSQCLVGNEPLRCWLEGMGSIYYASSNKLPQILSDPIIGQSEHHLDCAFQEAVGTKLLWWDWLQEPVQRADGSTGPNPEMETFNLAMLGGGRVLGPPLYADFPWGSLGSATIVDVGGGIGGMSLDLAKKFPQLRFVVQDLLPVIRQAKTIWERELPETIDTQGTQFMEHNFFSEQPIKGAEVYNLRYILHDWDDESCVQILTSLRPALIPNPESRILVSDSVMNTTYGSPAIPAAPPPLLANYGYAHRFAHMRDLNMMAIFNGRERTAEDLEMLAARAGLRVSNIWRCRGLIWITEFRLANG